MIALTNLLIVGRHLLTPRVVELLETQHTGADDEVQLSDALKRLLQERKHTPSSLTRARGCSAGTPAAYSPKTSRILDSLKSA